MLTTRALAALGPLAPRGFGKAPIGTDGDLEHGPDRDPRPPRSCHAARHFGWAGLDPGNAKVGAPGTSINVIFGGLDAEGDLDAMDTMPVSIPDAPRRDEILLVVAFLAGGRPNARTRGAPREAVAKLVADMQSA